MKYIFLLQKPTLPHNQ